MTPRTLTYLLALCKLRRAELVGVEVEDRDSAWRAKWSRNELAMSELTNVEQEALRA